MKTLTDEELENVEKEYFQMLVSPTPEKQRFCLLMEMLLDHSADLFEYVEYDNGYKNT